MGKAPYGDGERACSFCGTRGDGEEKLIFGDAAAICHGCVKRFNSTFAEPHELNFRLFEPLDLDELPIPAPRRAQTKIPLGQMLLATRLIKEDQLEAALAEQRRERRLLGEILVELEFATEEAIAETVSQQTGIPFVRLDESPVESSLRDLVPEEVCRSQRLVPIEEHGSVLRVAMANPFDVVALDFVRKSTGMIPFPSIAAWRQIRKKLDRTREAFGSF